MQGVRVKDRKTFNDNNNIDVRLKGNIPEARL